MGTRRPQIHTLVVDGDQVVSTDSTLIPPGWLPAPLGRVLEDTPGFHPASNRLLVDPPVPVITARIPAGDADDPRDRILVWTEPESLSGDLHHSQRLRSLGQLAAGVAHEINTPLQSALNNLRFLSECLGAMEAALDRLADGDGEPETVFADTDMAFYRAEAPDALEQTTECLHRVAAIVTTVRALGHPGSEPVPTRVGDLIRDTVLFTIHELKYVADVHTGEPPEPVRVLGHPGQLAQVLVNLLVNAAAVVRDLPDGTRGQVRVTAELDGDLVHIHVDDNGPGVPPGLRDRIFEPFFTTKPPGEGTGQGLALARSTVRSFGGDLTCGDSPLGGARFTVTLPIHDQGG